MKYKVSRVKIREVIFTAAGTDTYERAIKEVTEAKKLIYTGLAQELVTPEKAQLYTGQESK